MPHAEQDAELMQALDAVGRRGFAYAWQMPRNHDDALDAVQTALTAVWQHRRRLQKGCDPRGWFYRVLRNKCVDVMRSRRVRTSTALDADPPDRVDSDPARDADRQEQLAHSRGRLKPAVANARRGIALTAHHPLKRVAPAGRLKPASGTTSPLESRLARAPSTYPLS